MANYIYGIDIGGTTVKMGLFDEEGTMIDKWEIVTHKEDDGEQILPDIAASIKEKNEEKNIATEDILGIGMGVPGPITEEGVVLKCANLGWGIFSVADEVTRLTGVQKVKVGNDANVAALGEQWKGGGRGFDSIVMVTLGTGVGGGIVMNGKIVTGSHGAAVVRGAAWSSILPRQQSCAVPEKKLPIRTRLLYCAIIRRLPAKRFSMHTRPETTWQKMWLMNLQSIWDLDLLIQRRLLIRRHLLSVAVFLKTDRS